MEEHAKSRVDYLVDGQPVIDIKAAEYAWGFVKKASKQHNTGSRAKRELKNIETSVLKGITVELMKKDLLMVVGKIGSGKTSFLYSIMDETVKKAGSHAVHGRVAYVEQNPFIFLGTIQDNICFGLEYTECRFRKAIVAAQLQSDFEQFTSGSKTIIGQRGVNISNSLKARISLARALYQDADIYLLDDLFFHLEPIYAEAIFNVAIKKTLADKCVVLVTHQLEFLQQVDKIMVLRDGKQAIFGNFDQII